MFWFLELQRLSFVLICYTTLRVFLCMLKASIIKPVVDTVVDKSTLKIRSEKYVVLVLRDRVVLVLRDNRLRAVSIQFVHELISVIPRMFCSSARVSFLIQVKLRYTVIAAMNWWYRW